jgi:hypothetical protein
MQWRFWEHEEMDEGEKARLVHSRWLTDALASCKHYPRIPVRPVITGGFSRLMNRGNGPQRAQRWWEIALGRLE